MLGIGDYDKINSRRVRTRVDQVLFNGKKYRQDKKTGYYVCTSGERKRLHVAIWEAAAGHEVPAGYVIHHIDWDKTHNELSNFACVTIEEHNLIHNRGSEENLDERERELVADLKRRGLILDE